MSENTMVKLTEKEKQLIDDAPDKTLKFLFDVLLNKGMPAYFKLTLTDADGLVTEEVLYDGQDKVWAAMSYMEYLVTSGIRKEFRDE